MLFQKGNSTLQLCMKFVKKKKLFILYLFGTIGYVMPGSRSPPPSSEPRVEPSDHSEWHKILLNFSSTICKPGGARLVPATLL
jgi:hypothetical protein